jgi:hypothetical protein
LTFVVFLSTKDDRGAGYKVQGMSCKEKGHSAESTASLNGACRRFKGVAEMTYPYKLDDEN